MSMMLDNNLRAGLASLLINTDQRPLTICEMAYEARTTEWMRTAEHYSGESDDGNFGNDGAQAFKLVHHFVGRLASRIRAVKQLIEDAYRLQNLLSGTHLLVQPVPMPRCVDIPAADAHTNIRGIVRRLMPQKDTEYETLCQYLIAMDTACDISETIMSRHAGGDKALTPRVHSEVQMVDHFYTKRLRFRDDDRFIVSSKPACLPCKLYMKHHPIGCVSPDSHNKVHPNWGPILLPGGADDLGWVEHRNILIAMIHDIRPPVLQQIRTLSASHFHQADSLSQITRPDDEGFDHLATDDDAVSEGGHEDAIACKIPILASGRLTDEQAAEPSNFEVGVGADVRLQAAQASRSHSNNWDSDTELGVAVSGIETWSWVSCWTGLAVSTFMMSRFV